MKRLFNFLLVFIFAVSLVGCADNDYPTNTEYEGNRWTAQEANIYFDISNKYYESGVTNSFGQIEKDNENIDIYVATKPNGELYFFYKMFEKKDYSVEEKTIFRGQIKNMNNDKFVLKVYEEYQSFFGEEIKTLTFVREPTPGYVKYVKPE